MLVVFAILWLSSFGASDPRAQRCQSSAQSPINIVTATVGDFVPGPFRLDVPSVAEDIPATLHNSGSILELEVLRRGILLSGTGVGEVHLLETIKFHAWGEHLIDGVRPDAEVHLVFSGGPKSTVIIAIPFIVGATSEFLQPLTDAVPEAWHDAWGAEVPNFRFSFSLVGNYYVYDGSLTSAPCSETVRWLVLAQPWTLSPTQLSLLEGAAFGSPSAATDPMRPAQPLNSRHVSAVSVAANNATNNNTPTPQPEQWSYSRVAGSPLSFPENWRDAYPRCASSAQSPINLDESDLIKEGTSGSHWLRVDIPTYPDNDLPPVELVNTGRGVLQLRLTALNITLSGSTLTHTVRLTSLFLRAGSEHTRRERRTSAEVQLEFTHEESGEGVAMSVLLEVGVADPRLLPAVFAQLPRGTGGGANSTRLNFSPQYVLRDFLETETEFYEYDGSMTRPPCHEVVHWLVRARTRTLSLDQLGVLENLALLAAYATPGSTAPSFSASPPPATSTSELTRVAARPIQPHHGRTVYLRRFAGGPLPEDAHDYTAPVLFLFFTLALGMAARRVLTHLPGYLRIPYTIVMFLVGMALGEGSRHPSVGAWAPVNRAVTAYQNLDPHLVMVIFIPPLLFESSFSSNFHIVRKLFWQSWTLAFPGVVMATVLTALMVRGLFSHIYEWDWVVCFLFGAMVSATDPVAVVALLGELGADPRLATLIEGESLLNDGSASVLFFVFLDFAIGLNPSVGDVIAKASRLVLAGVALGFLFAGVSVFILHKFIFYDPVFETTLTLATTYLCFWVAESAVHASGLLAVVTLGMALSWKGKHFVSPESEHFLHHVWSELSFVANTIVFVLSGIITIQAAHASTGSDVPFLFAMWLGVQLVRAVVLIIFSPLLRRMGYGLRWQYGVIVWWAGLRGAVGLVLALIVQGTPLLPLRVRNQIALQMSGIVASTLLFNGISCEALYTALGLNNVTEGRQEVLRQSIEYLQLDTQSIDHALQNHPFFAGCQWDRAFRPKLDAVLRPPPSRLLQRMGRLCHCGPKKRKDDGGLKKEAGYLSELNAIMLHAIETEYHEALKRRAIRPESYELLFVGVQVSKDNLKAYSVCAEWRWVQRRLEVHALVHACLRLPVVSALARAAQFGAFVSLIEVVAHFLTAHREVLHLMESIADDEAAKDHFLRIQEELRQVETAAAELFEEWARDEPEMFDAACNTKYMETALRGYMKATERASAAGLLSNTEENKLLHIIGMKLHQLTFSISPPSGRELTPHVTQPPDTHNLDRVVDQALQEAHQSFVNRKIRDDSPTPTERISPAEAVTYFLTLLNLAQYAPILLENGFDSPAVMQLATEGDLRELGIKPGHRRVILVQLPLLSKIQMHTTQNPAPSVPGNEDLKGAVAVFAHQLRSAEAQGQNLVRVDEETEDDLRLTQSSSALIPAFRAARPRLSLGIGSPTSFEMHPIPPISPTSA